MAITIEGIKIRTISISRDAEKGTIELQGNYELISSTGIVLAKQGFNGYNEVKLEKSQETSAKLQDLVSSIQKDLNAILGLG